jgi:hypothetical protein
MSKINTYLSKYNKYKAYGGESRTILIYEDLLPSSLPHEVEIAEKYVIIILKNLKNKTKVLAELPISSIPDYILNENKFDFDSNTHYVLLTDSLPNEFKYTQPGIYIFVGCVEDAYTKKQRLSLMKYEKKN